MARAKEKSRQRPVLEQPVEPADVDDIELLNMYRYPEFYSDQENNRVRSSRTAQKRLEELLREMPERKYVRGKGGELSPESLEIPVQVATSSQSANGSGREEQDSENGSGNVLASMKNLLLKLFS